MTKKEYDAIYRKANREKETERVRRFRAKKKKEQAKFKCIQQVTHAN
jgi:hypothetical protein